MIDPRDKAIQDAMAALRGASQPAGRDLVVLSGGADSTLIAARLLQEPGRKDAVQALVVDGHPQMPTYQLDGQRVVIRRFQRWAKRKKLPLELTWLPIGRKGKANVQGLNPQALLWLTTILPYVIDGDRVHFGYVKNDDFWHWKEPFEAAFHAMCAFKGVKATLVYDLEWSLKPEVVGGLRLAGVPPECIWTCQSPFLHRGKPAQCGECSKCRELAAAIAEVERLEANPPQALRVSADSSKGEARKPAVFRWKPQPKFKLHKVSKTARRKAVRTAKATP